MGHGEPAHRSLPPACVLPDSRSLGSCELHSVKNQSEKRKRKKKVQHSTPEHPQQHHESCLQRPLLQHSLAWLQSGQQQKCETCTRKLHSSSACYTARLLGAVPRLSTKENTCGHQLRAESIGAGTDVHRKDPDQSQAGYEVRFCLALVPIINLNAKLLKGLPLGSHLKSTRKQAMQSATLQ